MSMKLRAAGSHSVSDLVEPVDWSSIPADILCLIAGKIDSADDFVRFCTVCRSWYSTATDFYDLNRNRLRFRPLLLMSDPDPRRRRVTLRNPSSDATAFLDLPVAPKTLRWGSPFGWIITFDHSSLRFRLLNPFTGATIQLPSLPISELQNRDSLRAFLTANPDSDPEDTIVVLSSGSKDLFFVRPARPVGLMKEWRHIEGGSNLCDVTLFKGELYGIRSLPHELALFQFQLNRLENGRIVHRLVKTLTLEKIPNLENQHPISESHIVDAGDLCLCVRYCSTDLKLKIFKIFKIDLPAKKVAPILSLADRCLFLGNNYSFACKASYSPSELFERPRREPHEFASNYVFYKRNSLLFEIEVWDVLRSEMVCERKDWLRGVFPPLWIVPSLKFRKLEDDGL